MTQVDPSNYPDNARLLIVKKSNIRGVIVERDVLFSDLVVNYGMSVIYMHDILIRIRCIGYLPFEIVIRYVKNSRTVFKPIVYHDFARMF